MRLHRSLIAFTAVAALLHGVPSRAALDDGRVRALRLRAGATLQTPFSSALPVNGDTTLRIMLKRNEWDLGARNVLSLVNSQGDVRMGIGYNTSPWIVATVTTLGLRSGSTMIAPWDTVPYSCPSGARYEDWWAVYKAPGPAGGADGYFRVYHNGALADMTFPGTPFDVPIAAGTDMTWLGGPLSLRIGDDVYGDRQDYQILDIAWWTAALTAADIAAIGSHQVALLPDAVRRTDDLYWYARPNPDAAGKVLPELGASIGSPAMLAYVTGQAQFVSDIPTGTDWSPADDVTPPDAGANALSATAVSTSINVHVAEGDGTAARRDVVLSRGRLHRYTTLAMQGLAEGSTDVTFENLTPGDVYHVTAIWEDAWGNRAERQVQVRMPGEAPSPAGEPRSLWIRGDGAARTLADETGTLPLYIELPFNSPGMTARIVVRRNAGMTGPNLFLSSRADKVTEYGYSRYSIGLDQHGHIVGKVSDGERVVVAESTVLLQEGVFEEIWLRYEAPSMAATGSARLYRRDGSTVKVIADSVVPAGDFSWKKWDSEVVLGGLDNAWPNSTVNYNLLEAAFWSKALTEAEMNGILGHGLYRITDYDRRVGDYLYWYARPHADASRIEPDLGNSIGTATIRRRDQMVGTPGIITPIIPTADASLVQFSTDAPGEYVGLQPPPFSLDDAAAALSIAAGLAPATMEDLTRLDVADQSAGVLDVADALLLARKSVGLETNP